EEDKLEKNNDSDNEEMLLENDDTLFNHKSNYINHLSNNNNNNKHNGSDFEDNEDEEDIKDPRMNDEAVAYTTIAQANPLSSSSVKNARARSEMMHSKINEKLLNTFKGTEEEKFIQISTNDSTVDQVIDVHT
ncbi:unnamed protein product, partial [Didymodactylos carnosus]